MTDYYDDPRDRTYGAEFEAYDQAAAAAVGGAGPGAMAEVRVVHHPRVVRLKLEAHLIPFFYRDGEGGPAVAAWLAVREGVIVDVPFPAFPPGIEGIPHKSHYVVSDLCRRHGLDERGHRYVCNRDHVHDTPKEAVACDRLDMLTESRDERAYRLGLDTENAPDSTV